jgi:hypothetical protein
MVSGVRCQAVEVLNTKTDNLLNRRLSARGRSRAGLQASWPSSFKRFIIAATALEGIPV